MREVRHEIWVGALEQVGCVDAAPLCGRTTMRTYTHDGILRAFRVMKWTPRLSSLALGGLVCRRSSTSPADYGLGNSPRRYIGEIKADRPTPHGRAPPLRCFLAEPPRHRVQPPPHAAYHLARLIFLGWGAYRSAGLYAALGALSWTARYLAIPGCS